VSDSSLFEDIRPILRVQLSRFDFNAGLIVMNTAGSIARTPSDEFACCKTVRSGTVLDVNQIAIMNLWCRSFAGLTGT
jgi:hypothetical protein